MKHTAFTYFLRRNPVTGKVVKSRYMVPLDELPKGAEPVGEVTWRDVPQTEEEMQRARYGMHAHSGYASMSTKALFAQLSLRILDMQLESAQCLAAAVKRSKIRPDVRECIDEALRRYHGMAAFSEPDPVAAFAELTLLDATSSDFKDQAEPLMRRIRRTRTQRMGAGVLGCPAG